MKKLVLFVSAIVLSLGLTACVPQLDLNEDVTITYTQEELEQLIQDVIDAQDSEAFTEEELQTMISDYITENVVSTTYTTQELIDLIEELIVDSSISTIYTQTELEDLIDNLIALADIDANYTIESFESDITEMVAVAQQGVLGVVTYVEETDSTYSGSGVIYKHEGDYYYMITNEHVVEGYSQVEIWYEKNGLLFTVESQNVEVLGMDATTDIAVIKFYSMEEFNVIPFADSYDIEVGDFVFAIGNPLGFDYYGTVTMGVISGVARYVQDDTFDATLLQHDAAISPGNSGGALININGELVGINNMKIVTEDVTGIGFAIPSNTVKRVAEDLEDDGVVTRPYLGVQSYVQINECGLDYGVCVDVQAGGAAEAAGVEDGDVIIGWKNITTGMDDYVDIYNFNDLREAILNSSVGDTIQLKYYRDGAEYESSTTTLNVHPDDQ